jgi:hypothetical protein
VYGAMLAGVDYVLMGAGIPVEIPALLDALAAGEPAELTVTVSGAAAGSRHAVGIDPPAIAGPAALPGYCLVRGADGLSCAQPGHHPRRLRAGGPYGWRAQRAAAGTAAARRRQRAGLRAAG